MGILSKKNDIARKTDALAHIQTAVGLLVGIGTQDTLNAWRYLKNARSALAEDVSRDARHEAE